MTKNRSNKFIVFTLFHPIGIKYFDEFINKYQKQTKINDLFITFNNLKPNKKIINKIKSINKFKIYTYFTDVNPGKSRLSSFKKLSRLNYKYIIFIDCDDIMEKNRAEKISKKIEDYDFFVNNLIPFKKKKFYKKILKKKNHLVKLNKILDNNYIGTSTLTIKSILLKTIIKNINTKLIALDWCIITSILIKKFKGIYVNDIITFYRQHNLNIHNKFSYRKKILMNIKIKKEHYEFFKNKDKIFNKKLKKLIDFERKFLKSPIEYSKKKYEKFHKWWVM